MELLAGATPRRAEGLDPALALMMDAVPRIQAAP